MLHCMSFTITYISTFYINGDYQFKHYFYPKPDPNINYNILHNTVQHFKEMHMPVKLEHSNKYKHKKSSWITHGIIHSIQFRDELHKIRKITDPTSVEHKAQTNVRTEVLNIMTFVFSILS